MLSCTLRDKSAYRSGRRAIASYYTTTICTHTYTYMEAVARCRHDEFPSNPLFA